MAVPEKNTITEEDASILFVKQVLVQAGRDFSLPKPSRRKRRRGSATTNPDAMQDLERFGRWFCSEWDEVAPELVVLRDITMLYKLMVQPQDLLNSLNRQFPTMWWTTHAKPEWLFTNASGDGKAAMLTVNLSGNRLFCMTDPEGVVSPARSSAYGLGATEDAVLLAQALPDFGDGALSKADTERVLCFLTAPQTVAPLLLDFFNGDRAASLVNPTLRAIVEAALFEPKEYNASPSRITATPTPIDNR